MRLAPNSPTLTPRQGTNDNCQFASQERNGVYLALQQQQQQQKEKSTGMIDTNDTIDSFARVFGQLIVDRHGCGGSRGRGGRRRCRTSANDT